MTTRIDFNVDEGLKNAAMKNPSGVIDRPLADDIDRSDDDIKHGRVTPYEEVLKELGFLRSP